MVSSFRSVAAALITVLALIASGANAQSNYPNKPIRLVVIFPAGGTADILARTVGQKLTESWGQQVVVDNRPGAGGNLATEMVAKVAPDGYTILLGGLTTHGINPSLYRKLPYDPVKDFTLMSLAAATPLVLVVNPSLPVQSMQELILLAKSRPREFNFASFGNGTSAHLCGVLFNSMAGIEMTHVAYKGSPQAVADLVAGRVQVMFDTIPVALPQIKAGRLKALAVTDFHRSNTLPEVPTVEEAGLPGFQVVG
jgi:tripartite-type tricarboxylate transporter receptor subunit TctC